MQQKPISAPYFPFVVPSLKTQQTGDLIKCHSIVAMVKKAISVVKGLFLLWMTCQKKTNMTAGCTGGCFHSKKNNSKENWIIISWDVELFAGFQQFLFKFTYNKSCVTVCLSPLRQGESCLLQVIVIMLDNPLLPRKFTLKRRSTLLSKEACISCQKLYYLNLLAPCKIIQESLRLGIQGSRFGIPHIQSVHQTNAFH